MTKAKDKVLRTTAAKHLKPTNANEKGKTKKSALVQRQENMQKPKWTQAVEESRSNNTLQQSLSPASDPADAQHGGSIQSESSSNIIADLIVLHSKKVLCDGYSIVEGQRRDPIHLTLCDILIEAVHSEAHVQLHFYHTCGVRTTLLGEFCNEICLAIGLRLVSKEKAKQVWEFAFSSANYVPTEHQNFLDTHVCPVFSRKWMEQQRLDFDQVIASERQRVQDTLEQKKARAEDEAQRTPGEADHIRHRHGLVTQRGRSFEDMHKKFAMKDLAVFETPRLGNCVAWALHWMKTGELPKNMYRDDEGENTEEGLSIVRFERETVSGHWLQDRHHVTVQQAFKMLVPEPTPFEDLSSSSPLSENPSLEKPCAYIMPAASVNNLNDDWTRGLSGVLGAHEGVQLQGISSSSSSDTRLPGNVRSDSVVLPGAPESRTEEADSDNSAVLNTYDDAAARVNLQLVPCRHVRLPAEALNLLDKYRVKICRFCEGDSSTLKTELEAFVTACHEGLLQKFALPGIPEWKAFMKAVSLMLRIVRVCDDAPLSFPLSKEFASAFALSCLLCIGVEGTLQQNMFATFISDHVDQLRRVCDHVQVTHNDAHVMKVSASVLLEFLKSLTNGEMEKESELGSSEDNHEQHDGSTWWKTAQGKVHELLSCIIQIRDLLLTIGEDLDSVHKGEIFLLGVFPCLEQLFPVSADTSASRYTVQPIAGLMWLMLYKLSAGSVAKNIGIGSFQMIRNTQNKDVQRLMPDHDSFTLLTDLLNLLWPTACKVSLKMDQWPACLWPSTLVALCEWMRQKECHSVEGILHLARHSSRHLIRAIQAECLQTQSLSSFSQYMVQQVLALERGLQGIKETRQHEKRLGTLTRKEPAHQEHSVNGSSAQTMPATNAQTMERNSLVANNSVAHSKSKKRQEQTANCADECKKQRVMSWLQEVQKHKCPTSTCKVCNRRGNWCIAGSAPKKVFAYISLYKRTPSVTQQAVNDLAGFIEALK